MSMATDFEMIIRLSAYIGGGIAMGLGAVGAAIGEGYTAAEANMAVSRNPKISGDIFKNMLVGQAVAESASIFALVIAILLLFLDIPTTGELKAAALFGAGLCMGFGAIGSGVGSGFPGGNACSGISRQPAAMSRLTTNMLIGSAVCQTPAIFSMVVALMLIFMDFAKAPTFPTWAALIGAGTSTGLAAIGSGYGGGLAAGASCEGISRQPESVGNVTTIMLVGQAVAQTPSIFGLLVSFILLFKSFPESAALSASMALLGAGLCMGFGGIGPGIGNGMAAEGAVRWVARNTEHAGDLMRTMLVGQAVSQSTAIYAMVISLVLIFVV
jgi:ATP synthase F0 subunit c